MNGRDDAHRREVLAWLNGARHEIISADVLMEHSTEYANAAFHARQAAEKYLKAFLIYHRISLPHTHDMSRLISLAAAVDEHMAETLDEAESLKEHPLPMRYPPRGAEVTQAAADRSIRIARLVRDSVLLRLDHAHDDSAADDALLCSPDYVVTTSRNPDNAETGRAVEWAERLDQRFVARAGRSLAAICREEGVGAVLTVTSERVGLLIPEEDIEYFFHPSMARTRIRNLDAGGGDPMIAAMRLTTGDSVLDCTLGRATDATVASYVAGESGSVVGYEAHPLIAALTIHGLRTYEIKGAGVQEAMRRIDARHGDCELILPQIDGNAFDVVYFDPFFERMVEASQSMQPLRRIGVHRPLSPSTYEEARRVASRCVVVKRRRGHEIEGLPEAHEIIGGGGSSVEYAILSCLD